MIVKQLWLYKINVAAHFLQFDYYIIFYTFVFYGGFSPRVCLYVVCTPDSALHISVGLGLPPPGHFLRKKDESILKVAGIKSRAKQKKKKSREEKVAQVAQNFARHFVPATFCTFKVYLYIYLIYPNNLNSLK